MRKCICLNNDWEFEKEGKKNRVNLPHTWNALDGQDGGDDYYQGICIYRKELELAELWENWKENQEENQKEKQEENQEVYLEFNGVNSSAEVRVNGIFLSRHEGGYSTFRVRITDVLKERNVIEVTVDNRANDSVYPQKADFTFYGGIYRDVNLILVPENHFSLDYYGTPGITVTPEIIGNDAQVTVKTYVSGGGDSIRITVDHAGVEELTCVNTENEAVITIENVHLWNGVTNPYLYHVRAELIVDGETVDEVETDFGCRSYSFDPDKGFLLNGKSYPLHGVSRHQDCKGIGNALTKEHHTRDMAMILEMGANAIRLAHYQHDQYFYNLCDRKGVIVWAEIPYITEHMPKGRENTISQLKELIVQNYNHPSIICWALSNEISVAGVTEDLLENHRILNELAHQMDNTRPTAMADAFMLETDSPLNEIPDILGYNLYYGWYMGELEDNDQFFDEFHRKHPDRCVGLTEYGADTYYKLQSPRPEKGDYSEQYQCIYHEHMLEMFEKRPYIWGTFVWNMFDFGADGREEAGDNGVNHKGLVSFDRNVKKDAFYLYKAWWSKGVFVHICGKRYADRVEEKTEIKVYSNQRKVALYQDGELLEEKEGIHVFIFQADISRNHRFEARSGNCMDYMTIRKVSEANPAYYLKTSSVKNWFDEPGMEVLPGYYSVWDTLEEISMTPEGKVLIEELVSFARASRGEVTKSVKRTPAMEKMLYRTTVIGLAKLAGGAITQDMVVELNQKLIKIQK